MRRDRLKVSLTLVALVAGGAFSACVRPATPPVVATPTTSATAPQVEAPKPSQYVIGDIAGALKLDAGETVGAIVEGVRVVQTGRTLRVAAEASEPPLNVATRLPSNLGGGFLFRSRGNGQDAIFVSPTFDGPLTPLASFRTSITDCAMGPGYVLVQLGTSERVAIDPRTGARVGLSPAGLVDVAAAEDGRVAAITTFGAALASADSGQHWTDVTAQLGSAPKSAALHGGVPWFVAESGFARVDASGHLTTFDAAPVDPPVTVRAIDPRWHDQTAPLRKALHGGALLDDGTALVVSQGALFRIDPTSGAVLSLSAARLPGDAECEGVRTEGDMLLVCRKSDGESIVASHTQSDDAMTIEQTFAAPGTFYAGDDGALAFGGPCTGNTASDATVCVRGPGGTWQEHLATLALTEAGAAQVSIDRWVPKTDGSAVGFMLSSGAPQIIDVRTGEIVTLPEGSLKAEAPTPRRYAGKRRYVRASNGGPLVDRQWTATAAGTLRGWTGNGSSVEIGADAMVTRSPYSFDQAATSGPFALALGPTGFWQSTDRGRHFVQVAEPPRIVDAADAKSGVTLAGCSPLGCDIGGFYRLGWEPLAPPPAAQPKDAARAPKLATPALASLGCAPLGTERQKLVTRTSMSPNDLGLGAAKTPYKETDELMHEPVYRDIGAHSSYSNGEGEDALRMLLTGATTTTGDDGSLKSSGPGALSALRRQLWYVAAFDPSATVRRSTLAFSDLFAAMRAAGLSGGSSLDTEPFTYEAAAPVLPADPSQPSEVMVGFAGGAIALTRSGGAARVAMQIDKGDDSQLASAAQLGDDYALLETESSGAAHVLRWSGGTVAPLFDAPAPPTSSPNPDALAIGPHGEVGILRTLSGGDPPSVDDPALVYLPGQAPVALAPWSTLLAADDPACKADGSGFRAIVPTIRPWLRGKTPDLDLDAHEGGQSLMRVKWSTARVCLEGLETRVGMPTLNAQYQDDPTSRPSLTPVTVATWLIYRALGTGAAPAGAGRIGVGLGFELTQPMRCSL